jgi:hypothetical protein
VELFLAVGLNALKDGSVDYARVSQNEPYGAVADACFLAEGSLSELGVKGPTFKDATIAGRERLKLLVDDL